MSNLTLDRGILGLEEWEEKNRFMSELTEKARVEPHQGTWYQNLRRISKVQTTLSSCITSP